MKKLISMILITTLSFSLFPSTASFVSATTETREKVDEVYGGPRKSKKSKVGKALAGIAGVAGGAAFAAKKLSSVANNGSLLKNSTNGVNGTRITPNPTDATTSYPVDVEKGNDQANVDQKKDDLVVNGTDSAENNSFCDDGKVNYETTGMDTCYNSKYVNVTAYTELVENGNGQANASKNNEMVNDSVVNGTDSAVSNSANVTTSYSVDVEKGNDQANVDQSNETGSSITNQEETDGSSQVTPDAINASDGKVDPNNPEEVRNSTDTEVESDENDPKTEEQPDDLKNQKVSINALSSALSSLSATGENNQGSSGSILYVKSLNSLQLPTPSEEKPNDDLQKLKNLPKLNDLISDKKSNFANATIDKCCDDRSSVCFEDCESASGENINSFGSNQEGSTEDSINDEEQKQGDEKEPNEPAKEPNTNIGEWRKYIMLPGEILTVYGAIAAVCAYRSGNNEPWKCFNPVRWLFNDGSQNKGVGAFGGEYGGFEYGETPGNPIRDNVKQGWFIRFLKSLRRFFKQDENNQGIVDLP